MQFKLLNSDSDKTYAVVFRTGEEFAAGLLAFAREQHLTAAHFTAIGAFQKAKLGWFNPEEKKYEENLIEEQVEVLSLVGNVAEHKGEPKVHAHVVLGKRDATACGGHVLEAYVRPTLEVTVTEAPRHLHRLYDEATGLPLIRPDQPDLPPRAGRSPNAGVRNQSSSDGKPREAQEKSIPDDPKRMGVGPHMGYSVSKPLDTTNWRECPDCKYWVHDLSREACPYCGYIFGQEQQLSRESQARR